MPAYAAGPGAAALMQRLGLGGVVRGMGRLLPPSLRRMQDIVRRWRRTTADCRRCCRRRARRRARVALFLGCAADAFFPQTTLATARVLNTTAAKSGCRARKGCCGALHYHAGLVEPAQQFAAANCAAFGRRARRGRCHNQQRRRLRTRAQGIRPSAGEHAARGGGDSRSPPR